MLLSERDILGERMVLDEVTKVMELPVVAARMRLLSRAARGRIVFEMDCVPSQPVENPPNLVGSGSFCLDRLLSHIDPGTMEESEDFVRLIYDQRRIDLSSDRSGQTGC